MTTQIHFTQSTRTITCELKGYCTSFNVTLGTPMPSKPHGYVTIEGDIELALSALMHWVNEKAIETVTGWTWREAIADSLRLGHFVNFDLLPLGVILDRLGNRERPEPNRNWVPCKA